LGAASPYAFTVHGDDAPTFYLAKKGTGGGQLGQTDPVAREFERDMAKLTAMNPYTGATDPLLVRMADQTGMKALHMITTGDPVRNASFVLFADANYFLTDFPANTCKTCINPLFAWNHGDIQNEIANTWLSFVGPGVRNRGQDDETWSDHADVRPTILSLVGLEDSYVHDGRVLFEAMDENVLPLRLRGHKRTLPDLVNVFKQINAPFDQFALDSLSISTVALASNTTNDTMYAALQSKITGFTSQRDAIADDMKATLDGSAFGDEVFDEVMARQLLNQGQALLDDVKRCAANPVACAQ
jgi:hypothetical protein